MKKVAFALLLISVVSFSVDNTFTGVLGELIQHCKCTKIHQPDAERGVKVYTVVCDSTAKKVFKFFKQPKSETVWH